jgi:hypothetical protein
MFLSKHYSCSRPTGLLVKFYGLHFGAGEFTVVVDKMTGPGGGKGGHLAGKRGGPGYP